MSDIGYSKVLCSKCLQSYHLGSCEREKNEVPVDLMQRVWMNLYYDEAEAGGTFQRTLDEVVDWLARRDALPPLQYVEGER